MRFIHVAIVLILCFGCDTAQNTPSPEESFFLRYYGADGNQESVDMIANGDGTFILLGNSFLTSDSPGQIYLVKVNNDGFVLWEKFIGTSADERARDIEPLAGGGYIVLADVVTEAEGTNLLLIIIDDNGEPGLTTTFTYTGSSDESGASVTQLYDGTTGAGFIVAGSTNNASLSPNKTAIFPRFNQDLTVFSPWIDSYGAVGDDFCLRIFQNSDLTSNSPFIFFGYSNSTPNNDAGNATLNFWKSNLGPNGGGANLFVVDGSPNTSDEILGSISKSGVSPLSSYLLAGVSKDVTNPGNDLVFIAKLNDQLVNDGVLPPQSLTVKLGDTGTDSRILKVSTCESKASGYWVAATQVISGNADIVLTRIGVDGAPVLESPIVLGGQGTDFQSALYELPDRRIMVFGTMQIGDDRQSKMVLAKLSARGKFE
jgi:hypothetical protein